MFRRFILFIGIAAMIQACVTYERCVDKFGDASQDTTYVTVEKHIPVHITTPGDSISGAVDLDSLVDGQVNQITDENSNLTLQYWIDEYNRLLHMKALNPPMEIRDTVFVRDTVPCPPAEPALVEPPPGRLERIYEKYKEVAAWAFPTIILTLLILSRWIRK